MNLPLNNMTAQRDETLGLDATSPTTTGEDIAAARFAALVHVLCPDAPPVDSACMRRMAAMLADGDWQCSERQALERLLSAARQTGAFDPALQDIAWPRLSREGEAYADFVRLRALEAQRRHQAVGSFGFDRQDWLRAHDAEAALRDHQRHVRESSYAPDHDADVFRVH